MPRGSESQLLNVILGAFPTSVNFTKQHLAAAKTLHSACSR